MIDIHSHILPGIDDGPGAIDESVDMCRMAAADGISTIVATPHFKPGVYEPSSIEVDELINTIAAKTKEKGINIQILSGGEVFVTPELLIYLKKVRHLTINKTNRYFLAEFPPVSVPPNWEAFLLFVLKSGFFPIITHPERNAWFMNHPNALYSIVSKGVLVQITAMSLTGELGDDIQEFSVFLLKHNLVHIIATDAHSAVYRKPELKIAVEIARDIIGKEKAEALVTSIPDAIIHGKPCPMSEPVSHIKQEGTWLKKFFFCMARLGSGRMA
ncbi:MAG: CpsB/CapC family capsule biosynthesis tyrosine phosphatase [Pseudomonadota bacterium]